MRPVRLTPGAWLALVVGAVPWAWFLVRDLSPRMDAIALLWPPLAAGVVVALVIGAIVVRRPELGLSTASWVVVSVVVVVFPWRPIGGPPPEIGLRVVAANTLGANVRAPAGIASDLMAQRPELLVVSEITPELDAVLRRQFAHRVADLERTGPDRSDVAVYSRYPLRSVALPSGLTDQRGSRVIVSAPSGRVVLYALHLQKPGIRPSDYEVGFRTYGRLVDRLVDAVHEETSPVIVAGDLNMADRTSAYRVMTGVLDDGMRDGWVTPTSLRSTTRWLLARIDQIFMPAGWCRAASDTFEVRGSDHRGIATTLGPC
jgi:endonuclease/exonuclease/phosphatase (EEP) superfamily protein YafD